MNMIAIDWKIAMLAPNCQMRPGRALAGALLKAHPEARSAGAIRTRVAQLDPDALGPALTAFVMVEALEHTAEWRTGSRTTTRTTRTQG
ncbi:MAG: Lrp/AsnC family transcriptional regulator [Roseovarius sp.]|nr:Lrp/AsnC family transcriptional regulator [Roseovarius sp.]